MIEKPLEDINKEDIEKLIPDKREEGRMLEFKLELKIKTDGDKKEFIDDIISFANAIGGDIIFGIEEEELEGKNTGRAKDIKPISGWNENTVKLDIHNIIRSGVKPTLPIHVHPIDGFEKEGLVVLVRIPQGLFGPYINTKRTSPFCSRNSNGKYHMEIDEIRNQFITTMRMPERIREFRAERLSKVISDDTPYPLLPDPKLVIHYVPLKNFIGLIEGKQITFNSELKEKLKSFGIYRHNLDGLLSRENKDGNKYWEYTILFRSGCIEYVDSYKILMIPRNHQEREIFPIEPFITNFVEVVNNHKNILRILEVEYPVFMMVSLLGVRNLKIDPDKRYEHYRCERNDLILPEQLIQNETEWNKGIKEIADLIYQSFGMEQCDRI